MITLGKIVYFMRVVYPSENAFLLEDSEVEIMYIGNNMKVQLFLIASSAGIPGLCLLPNLQVMTTYTHDHIHYMVFQLTYLCCCNAKYSTFYSFPFFK